MHRSLLGWSRIQSMHIQCAHSSLDSIPIETSLHAQHLRSHVSSSHHHSTDHSTEVQAHTQEACILGSMRNMSHGEVEWQCWYHSQPHISTNTSTGLQLHDTEQVRTLITMLMSCHIRANLAPSTQYKFCVTATYIRMYVRVC